jgi:hypothetical protein
MTQKWSNITMLVKMVKLERAGHLAGEEGAHRAGDLDRRVAQGLHGQILTGQNI